MCQVTRVGTLEDFTQTRNKQKPKWSSSARLPVATSESPSGFSVDNLQFTSKPLSQEMLSPGQSSCCNVWDKSCAGCSGVPAPGWSCDVITAVSCPGKKLLCLSCVSGRHLEQKWGFLPKVRRGLAALLPSAQHASSRAGQPSASLALILQHATFFQRRLF